MNAVKNWLVSTLSLQFTINMFCRFANTDNQRLVPEKEFGNAFAVQALAVA